MLLAACVLSSDALGQAAPVAGQLPPLPDRLGLGGSFAGVSNDALIVAGGANFDEEVWGEGEKTWHDEIYVLEPNREA
jgi:N-acetylneuraminic acid mutarotase